MKNSQKGFVVPLLIGIIVLLVIGGVVMYYVYQNKVDLIAPVDMKSGPLNQDQQTNSQINSITPISAQGNQSSVKPSITILSPNGGENWKIGQTYTISFAKTGELGSITVRLNRYSDDGVRVGAETIGTTNSNTFSFKIPVGTSETRGNAGRYKIQAIVDKYNSGMGVADESDNYFSITAPNIVQPTSQTYTNYGFTIKYPSNWIAKENLGAQNTTIEILSPEHDQYLRNNPNAPYQGQYNDVVIVVHGYPWTAYNSNSVKSVMLNGLSALKYDYSGVYESETYIVSNNQTRTFTITSLSLPTDDATRKAIVSSFALTN